MHSPTFDCWKVHRTRVRWAPCSMLIFFITQPKSTHFHFTCLRTHGIVTVPLWSHLPKSLTRWTPPLHCSLHTRGKKGFVPRINSEFANRPVLHKSTNTIWSTGQLTNSEFVLVPNVLLSHVSCFDGSHGYGVRAPILTDPNPHL